jgi:hypothetical protein
VGRLIPRLASADMLRWPQVADRIALDEDEALPDR